MDSTTTTTASLDAPAAPAEAVPAETAAPSKKGSVTLVSHGGEAFRVSVEVAQMSLLVAAMLAEDANGEEEDEDGGGGAAVEEREIPLPNVKAPTLARVIEYCEHYVTKQPMLPFEKPIKSKDLFKLNHEFYASFITRLDNEALLHLTKAADYLDIKPLLELCLARVASMIKDSSTEELSTKLAMPAAAAPVPACTSSAAEEEPAAAAAEP